MARHPTDVTRRPRPAAMRPRASRLDVTEKDSPMSRPPRKFRTEAFELEGRLLLANVPASTAVTVPVVPLEVNVGGTLYSTGSPPPAQVVGQQDGDVTVWLTRTDNQGTAQVQVKTDPSSPDVGVNVGAVDQTVTFANGDRGAAVIVPILSGA